MINKLIIYSNSQIPEPATFAGVTSLTATGESSFEIEYKLGVEIQNVKTWLDAKKLALNEVIP